MNTDDLLEVLTRRGIVTIDTNEAYECCGLPRDADGFCSYRPGHPIYVGGWVGDDGHETDELTVCPVHLRFVPCRKCKPGAAVFSTDPEDVARTKAHQWESR